MSEPIAKPCVGQPLPRGADAYSSHEKWVRWILADRGHRREWARVFRVTETDIDLLRRAILDQVLTAHVHKVVDHGQHGVVCGVDVRLTIRARTAIVRTSWHYKDAKAAPRLVTAYPRL